jgi:hypothetical protein
MRLRQLGHGQSVMFIAPCRIDDEIRRVASKTSNEKVEVVDILRWTMLETLQDVLHHIPHWAEQGVHYLEREAPWQGMLRSSCSDLSTAFINELRTAWLRPEARSLEMMYGPCERDRDNDAFDIPALRERLQLLGINKLSESNKDEEQERELSHELEMEQEVERPPQYTPAQHSLHRHLRDWVECGVIPIATSPAFVPLFGTIWTEREGLFSPAVLATADFAKTMAAVALQRGLNDYLRPVNWILSSRDGSVIVIISPFEAENLLSSIRKSRFVHLHTYAPRVLKDIESFEGLDFYSIPSVVPGVWKSPSLLVMSQLNLFAGQLYFKEYAHYVELCRFFGVCWDNRSDMKVGNDGFVKPENRDVNLKGSGFTTSPTPFLKELTSRRRRGHSFASTHIGKLLEGRILTEEDFS